MSFLQALRHCWGNGFLDVFRAYFREHAELFRGMTHAMNQNEHTLEQHACFNEYLKLYEKQLGDYIEKDPNGPQANIADFYSELAEAKETGFEDPGTAEFIHCLVASADYDSFYSVMVREGMRLEQREAQAKFSSEMQIPNQAEAKSSGGGGGGAGGKGGPDDEEEDEDDKGYK